MNGFLSPQNKKEVDQTLANIRQVTGDLKATQAKLDNLLGELNGVAAENRPALQATIADLAQITSALAKRIDAIAHNLESSSRNFNEFTREVRKAPNRLLITPKPDKLDDEKEQQP
jgi:phospholipid/cholesterol/gamma-HCH transport system substrate-binding protein